MYTTLLPLILCASRQLSACGLMVIVTMSSCDQLLKHRMRQMRRYTLPKPAFPRRDNRSSVDPGRRASTPTATHLRLLLRVCRTRAGLNSNKLAGTVRALPCVLRVRRVGCSRN
ncbi:hypothetical protein GGR52DRAFT_288530 [Hypoxylon sp. FL1284]|nr:hypothetical protein GGR52DRAFT_288530 [Hypoxylon sp. FL1284]